MDYFVQFTTNFKRINFKSYARKEDLKFFYNLAVEIDK